MTPNDAPAALAQDRRSITADELNALPIRRYDGPIHVLAADADLANRHHTSGLAAIAGTLRRRIDDTRLDRTTAAVTGTQAGCERNRNQEGQGPFADPFAEHPMTTFH